MAEKRMRPSNKTLKEIIQRDGPNCKYCGKPGKTTVFLGKRGGQWLCIEHEIDHVMPLNAGGSNDITNLVVACRSCNRSKKDKVGWAYGS